MNPIEGILKSLTWFFLGVMYAVIFIHAVIELATWVNRG